MQACHLFYFSLMILCCRVSFVLLYISKRYRVRLLHRNCISALGRVLARKGIYSPRGNKTSSRILAVVVGTKPHFSFLLDKTTIIPRTSFGRENLLSGRLVNKHGVWTTAFDLLGSCMLVASKFKSAVHIFLWFPTCGILMVTLRARTKSSSRV